MLKILSIINWPQTADIDCGILSPKTLGNSMLLLYERGLGKGQSYRIDAKPKCQAPIPFPERWSADLVTSYSTNSNY
jgi:hypothetical protein